MPSQPFAVAAVLALTKELVPGLTALRAVASADLYEDIHEVLMNQINRASILLVENLAPGIHFCDQLLKQIFEMIEDNRVSHQRALETLVDTEHQPYCLYLRNFDFERSDFVLDAESSGAVINMIRRYQTGAEDVLGTIVEACGPDLPVIGVHNLWSDRDPAAKLAGRPERQARMLSLRPDAWKPSVEALIGGAHVIVLYVDSRSDGIRWEMERLAAGGHGPRTIVVGTRWVRTRTDSPFGELEAAQRGVATGGYENRSVDFDDVLGELSREFDNVAVCGEDRINEEQLADAMRMFLERQRDGLSRARARPDLARIDFSLASAVPGHVRAWAESGVHHFGIILDHALSPECAQPLRLAAASAQGIVAYSVLTSNFHATAIGLGVLAAIEDLPALRDQPRRLDGRKRSELSEENLRRAERYAELSGDAGLSGVWFERARSFLADAT